MTRSFNPEALMSEKKIQQIRRDAEMSETYKAMMSQPGAMSGAVLAVIAQQNGLTVQGVRQALRRHKEKQSKLM